MDSANEAPKMPIHKAFEELSKVKVPEQQEKEIHKGLRELYGLPAKKENDRQ